MVAAAEVAEEEIPIPAEEEEGKVAELLTPHFPYIPDDTEGLFPSIFDNVDGPSLKVKIEKYFIYVVEDVAFVLRSLLCIVNIMSSYLNACAGLLGITATNEAATVA
jgi:hypothetical protein